MKFSCPAIFILILFTGCKRNPDSSERAFYFWKTRYLIRPYEAHFLKELKIRKLYLRFFDVGWNDIQQLPEPVAEISFADRPDSALHIIPVVYITTKALEKARTDSMPVLALHIYRKVATIASQQAISFSELQLDCDWTEKTRCNYFLLIQCLKKSLRQVNKSISVTIRLHQIKYAGLTGIPDADRGMLLFYNMGNVKNKSDINSIYNETDANRYVEYTGQYSLPLDMALPVFYWAVHIRGEQVIGLMNKIAKSELNLPNFTSLGDDRFRLETSFYFRGEYLMKGDLLKLEEVSANTLVSAAKKAACSLKAEKRTVALFDLDSVTISRYEKSIVEETFDLFN